MFLKLISQQQKSRFIAVYIFKKKNKLYQEKAEQVPVIINFYLLNMLCKCLLVYELSGKRLFDKRSSNVDSPL